MTRKIYSLAMLIMIHLLTCNPTIVRAADQLTLGTGQPGSEAHQLGVGLAALVKVIVLPNEGVDLVLANGRRALAGKHLYIERQPPLETLLADQPAEAFQSVMAFKPEDAADDLFLELIAHADVSADNVYVIVRAIFENGPFLNTTSERVWDLSIEQTLRDLQLPIHPGALRYYRETGGLEQQTVDGPPVDVGISAQHADDFDGESTFFVYFDGPDARLDSAAQEQVAAACRYAARYETPFMQISGHSGRLVDEVADGLTADRLQSVMAALGQDTNCGDDTAIVASNEIEATLPDQLLEADDDRVEITIMLPTRRP